MKDLFIQIEREFKTANEERNALKDNLAQANLKNEVSSARDRQLTELINNVKANSSEEIKRYVELGQKLTDTKLRVMQAERSESNMREKVEYMDKVYQELLKRIRSLEEENVKMEQKAFEQEDEVRKKVDQLNRSMQELT